MKKCYDLFSLKTFQSYLLLLLTLTIGEVAYGAATEETYYGNITLYTDKGNEDGIRLRLSVPKGLENQTVTLMRCEGPYDYLAGAVCEQEVEWIQYPFLYEVTNVFEANTDDGFFLDTTAKSNTAYSYHLIDNENTSVSSTFASSMSGAATQYDALIKEIDDAAGVKFYFEPAPDETIREVQLLYTFDEEFHQTPILDYLAQEDDTHLNYQTVPMIYNAQTQTWEAVLTGVPAQTKIDYKFSYQTDAIQSMQASPPTSYVVDGLAVPLGRRYVDDEMHNQAVTLRWPMVPVPAKQSDPITYEIYSRPVSLDPVDPWEGDWRLLTEEPLDEPEFVHDGLQAGTYYDYFIITKNGPYQSLASPILRAKTDNIYTPPPSEPKIDPEADVPGAWMFSMAPAMITANRRFYLYKGKEMWRKVGGEILYMASMI